MAVIDKFQARRVIEVAGNWLAKYYIAVRMPEMVMAMFDKFWLKPGDKITLDIRALVEHDDNITLQTPAPDSGGKEDVAEGLGPR